MEQKELQVTFDINTIDHLGVKLYSTIPPMIAELVSNAWDADANNVYIRNILAVLSHCCRRELIL